MHPNLLRNKRDLCTLKSFSNISESNSSLMICRYIHGHTGREGEGREGEGGKLLSKHGKILAAAHVCWLGLL